MDSEVNILFSGAAGQGIQTTAQALGKAATRAGYYAFSYLDAESRIRGGLNFTYLRISTMPRPAYSKRVDILVAQTKEALDYLASGLHSDSVVLVQDDWPHPKRAPFTLLEYANKAGSAMSAGTVAAAAVAAIIGMPEEIFKGVIHDLFGRKENIEKINLLAARMGYEKTSDWEPAKKFRLPYTPHADNKRFWISGGETIALGAVAGGVAFIAAYPMSPSTSIMTKLAQWAARTGVVVEQAEDEIAAINMVAGASYAGARAMTATSGGGFDLMAEGISLIGMAELPAVVAVAQRPGPSTNLATRTQQSDLHLVLHSGHGHFARVVLAPKNISDGFEITARAFDIAEKYQAPVFILTDQQLQEGEMTVEPFDVSTLPRSRHFLDAKTLDGMESYHRFETSASGISPIAAPGVSKHLVIFTSDEHAESGHITEQPDLVQKMVEKRLCKIRSLETQLISPLEVEGKLEGNPLLIGWGSSYEPLSEARLRLAESGIEAAHLHFRQLWPLQADRIIRILDRASLVIVVENNLNGELSNLLQGVVLRPLKRRINKYNGRPFTVEELVERIASEVKS